jgi:uncharacterized protein (DUF111 family)
MVNVDDVNGETVSHVINEVMDKGAKNIHVVPAFTKKGRPEYIFYVDADEETIDSLGLYFARELGTIGMRVLESRHMPFDYKFQKVLVSSANNMDVQNLPIRVKQVLDKKGSVISVKADYEDLKIAIDTLRKKSFAINLSFTAFKGLVEQVVLGQKDLTLGDITVNIKGENEK